MNVEKFDIVDLQDKPTGELITKVKAHETGAPHRVAAVFVFDDDDNLLMQVHKGMKGQLDHTVGGHVSAGEDYHTAAVREMYEEIGLKAQLKEVALSVKSDEQFEGGKHFHMFGIFEAKTVPGWQFKAHDEVDELIPKPIADIVKDMQANPDKFTRGFLNTMQAYLEAKELPHSIDARALLKGRPGP